MPTDRQNLPLPAWREAERTIRRFMKRALWMGDPMSAEFRIYFYEMVTEIRRLAGRDFNADASLSDLHHALGRLFERFPAAKRITLDAVLKAADTVGSYSKLTDLLAVSTAVTTVFLPAGAIFVGGAAWIILRAFAPARLKCAVAMGIGGVLASDLYRIPEPPPGTVERKISIVPALVLPAALALAGIGLPAAAFLLRLPALAILGSVLLGLLLAALSAALLFFTWKAKAMKSPELRSEDPTRAFFFENAASVSTDSASLFMPGVEERRFSSSLTFHLAQRSVESMMDPKIQTGMRLRLSEWKIAITAALRAPLVTDESAFRVALKQAAREIPENRRILMLIDAALSSPFEGLSEPGGKQFPLKARNIPAPILDEAARDLGVTLDVKRLRSAYLGALSAIGVTETWKKVLSGFFSGESKTPAGYMILPMTTATLAFPLRDGGKPLAGGHAFLYPEDSVREALASPEALQSALARLEAAWKALSGWPAAKHWAAEISEGLIRVREHLAAEANRAPQGREDLRRALQYYEIAVKRWKGMLK